MPAPLAKGIIIAASVLVAAGIAIYESPQVRQWVDQSRRKIAVALHSLGDDIQPRRPSESSDDFEEREKRREELIRRNRNELVRRAREEGVAVDLDELARIGDEAAEQGRRRQGHSKGDRTKSFDTLVGDDGMLRGDTTATTNTSSDAGLRKRGVAGFAAGSAAAANISNPFSDDAVLFDHDNQDQDEAPSPKPFPYTEPPPSRESTATLPANDTASPPSSTATLIDLTPDPSPTEPLSTSETNQAAQSFYSFTSSPSRPSTPTPNPSNNHPDTSTTSPFSNADAEAEADTIPTPTLTPRSTRSLSLSSNSSINTSPATADAIAILSMQNSFQDEANLEGDGDADTRSDAFSESGFTDAEFSDAGFSEATGVMTPSSWTEVGSLDGGSEWGE
ncbi:hypothetical protein T440DRAFT_469146 [Plenodomus tracheiphilus IPT5]|uniref:Uncharacterized protein n=1 Tax=Plenodomus tracheiphilus IPT5 TaxID=1408161 RepID=A0A6A7B387_9PLEO|nr:hypothetical protein T440DRAFT_469146 [Plenodomus tracheiphilus IPT5]